MAYSPPAACTVGGLFSFLPLSYGSFYLRSILVSNWTDQTNRGTYTIILTNTYTSLRKLDWNLCRIDRFGIVLEFLTPNTFETRFSSRGPVENYSNLVFLIRKKRIPTLLLGCASWILLLYTLRFFGTVNFIPYPCQGNITPQVTRDTHIESKRKCPQFIRAARYIDNTSEEDSVNHIRNIVALRTHIYSCSVLFTCRFLPILARVAPPEPFRLLTPMQLGLPSPSIIRLDIRGRHRSTGPCAPAPYHPSARFL